MVTSAFWQVNAVALRAGGEAVLIDSPYLPDELDALPGLLAGAGFEPDGLLRPTPTSTICSDGSPTPSLTLGMAELSVERLRREPGQPSASCATTTPSSTSSVPRRCLGAVQGLPV